MFEREEWVPAQLRQALIGLAAVALLGLFLAGLGYLLVAILRAAMARHAPMLAAIGVGGTTLLSLGLLATLVRAIARRISPRPAVQRSATILGFALVMAFWPILMVWMIFLSGALGG